LQCYHAEMTGNDQSTGQTYSHIASSESFKAPRVLNHKMEGK
jgi:hypothetical protein